MHVRFLATAARPCGAPDAVADQAATAQAAITASMSSRRAIVLQLRERPRFLRAFLQDDRPSDAGAATDHDGLGRRELLDHRAHALAAEARCPGTAEGHR